MAKPKMPAKIDLSAEAWDAQPGEPMVHYGYFLKYRDMGPSRTITKLSKKAKVSRPTLYTLSSRYNWQERAALWDAENERVYRAELKDEIKKTARNHAKLGNALIEKATEALAYYAIDNEDGEPKILPLREIPKWVEMGVKISRLGLGMDNAQPTEGEASSGPEIDITDIVFEALATEYPEALEALIQKLRPVLNEDRGEQR